MIIGATEALFFANDSVAERAQSELNEAGFSDGLPLIVPTQRRMDEMLDGVAGPARSLGAMAPMLGEVTIEAVAYCSVLAGCRPAELPVVLTAAWATLEPDFNLLGLQTTTGTPAVCLAVHGPIVRELGMNAEGNCLGPGNRANACIGRALQLVLRNVGGAVAGISDMATMGHPGKYVFCFAEGESSAIPSLARRREIEPGASAVTVIGVSGTLEVIPQHAARDPQCVAAPIVDAMHGARLAHDSEKRRRSDEQFVLVPPEVFDRLEADGWDLRAMQEFIWKSSPRDTDGQNWPLARTPEDINIILTGGIGIKMTCLVPWSGSLSITRPLIGRDMLF